MGRSLRPTVQLCAVILLLFLACALPALAAPWIAADWAGKEPQFPAASLHFQTGNYKTCPVLYRTVLTVDSRPVEYAGFRVQGSWYVYVFLNGKQVAAYTQKGEGAITKPVDVELTPLLHPGRNVLAISTTGDGFSLEGAIGYRGGKAQPIASTATGWRVQKLAPLTMLEWEPCMQPGFDDSGWFASKPAEKEPVTLPANAVRELCEGLADKRLAGLDDEGKWRLRMLSQRGIAIVGWEAHGFAGAARLPQWVRDAAAQPVAGKPGSVDEQAEALTRFARLSDEATNAANYAIGLRALKAPAKEIEACQTAALMVRGALDTMARAIKGGKYAAAVTAAAKGEAAMAQARRVRVITDLGWSIDNKFAWFDNNALMDNDLGNWGLRFNPVEVSWKLSLDGKWRFKTDPDNTGLEEKRQTFGYNIENQWQELNVPGSWERQGIQMENPKAISQSPYPGVNVRSDGPYNGFAWYRKTLRVPQEWAGYDLELYVSMVDDWDWGYFNGEEIGHTGAKTANWWNTERHYRIPKEKVQFGGYNVIALRVYDCGAEGIVGSVELRCPGLKDAFENKPKTQRKPTECFASPLSPAALLTVGEKDLVLWGWDQRGVAGPSVLSAVLGMPVMLRADAAGVVYDAAKQGKISENWMLLSNPDQPEKPIELVFLDAPSRVAFKKADKGTSEVRITFDKPGARLFVLRPGVAPPAPNAGYSGRRQGAAALGIARIWSQALLSYPVSVSETYVPDGPWSIRVADVFNYWDLRDAWGTQPMRIAPLAPLASYGLKTGYPGLKVLSPTQDLGYSLGKWGEHVAAVGTDTITYRVPLDRMKRYGGFTSYCFSPADVGVPGNVKEVESIKRTGANSFRPQHNQNGEAAMKLVRWCWDQGIQNMFNVDGMFAAQEGIFEHYRKLAEQCKDLPPDAVAYDLINEPANMEPGFYNPRVKKLTEVIRAIDKTHPIYVETPFSFASVSQFINLEATGDELTCYSFHDYDYRLPVRWPHEELDIRNIMAQWLPALKFSIDNRAPIHLGEFGGFEQTKQSVYDNRCTETLMLDFFRVFDQFGWHWNYYANRGTVTVRADGSLRDSWVQEAHRRYFARGTFNVNR